MNYKADTHSDLFYKISYEHHVQTQQLILQSQCLKGKLCIREYKRVSAHAQHTASASAGRLTR